MIVKPFFKRGPSLQRLFLAIIMAITIIVVDSRISCFTYIRSFLGTSVSIFYFLANGSKQLFDIISEILTSQQDLKLENEALRHDLFLKNSDLLMLKQYQQENANLRNLLGLPLRQGEKKMVAQVISMSTSSSTAQIIINKGSMHGVYEGEPVINDKGVIGQVAGVNSITSRVLLICDVSHALPIQIFRNAFQAIAVGKGYNKDLHIEHLPNHADVQVGDLLVTSGLGSRFPEGYPVAFVSSVEMNDQKSAFAIIHAHPIVNLQCLRYLLLWNPKHRNNDALSLDRIH
ncbi:hypothetical protein HHS_02640 [Candidatus Pantoea carbekii]|uniref:Cell shape-determining protein MreC n=1 Tax=Candidatus Pantoea carbekii TaxID=1235990 RepID=U3U7J7_9GAMM|nr:hypothetical protein HHS_02640 [Candidatus Pantoea carbekii]